jgi:hypothetical protein
MAIFDQPTSDCRERSLLLLPDVPQIFKKRSSSPAALQLKETKR